MLCKLKYKMPKCSKLLSTAGEIINSLEAKETADCLFQIFVVCKETVYGINSYVNYC